MYIDEWFEDCFYEKLGLNYRNTFCFGQIFWTHAYYPHENLQLFRPRFAEDDKIRTITTKFELQSAGGDAFDHNLPLSGPKLETNEEFIAIKAKRRPVILIRPEMPILESVNTGFRGKVFRKRCLIAQMFSIEDKETGQAKFGPNFVNRIRQLEFPQLMFLPKNGEVIKVDSILRLDECQSVFTPHLQPEQYKLCDQVQILLRQQLQYLFLNTVHEKYDELREVLLLD